MAYREKDRNGKRHIFIKNTKTEKITKLVEEREELIRGFGWINDQRVVYVMDKGGDENYHIYAIDINGSNSIDLTPFEGVQANIVNILEDQKDYMIVAMNKDNRSIFEPYRINVNSGALTKLFENKDPDNPIQDFIFDKDGNLRGYSQTKGLGAKLYYKDLKSGTFNLVLEGGWDDTFKILDFDYASQNPNDAYVLSNLASDKTKIYLYDFQKNSYIKEIFANDDYDVSGIKFSKKRGYEVDAFAYVGEKLHIVPVSNYYKKLTKRLFLDFDHSDIDIVDQTDDESKYLILESSDKITGIYYLYDTETDKLTKLYDLKPNLKAKDMASMKPITFRSRDGLTIHGYITLPNNIKSGQKVPMIVNPHGGPQGIRDIWGFNPEVQLFASRGYATLQVNFRISGGYGKKFEKSGYKQIGAKVMDDIEDGVNYVLKHYPVDKEKIAIYGASHGGYATLMGLIRTPDLYTCGVDYVGVSNIETFMKSIPPYWKPYLKMIKEIWYDIDDPKEKESAHQYSPIHQIDKIKKPLFVIQGRNDPRVNINESNQIVGMLRSKGFDVPYLVKDNEGHGFHHEENRLELYKAMMGFFAKYLRQYQISK